MPSTNDQILDLLVRHQIGLQRLATQTLYDVQPVFEQGDVRVVQLLETINTDSSIQDIDRALRAIKQINEQTYAGILASLMAAMVAVTRYEIDFQGNVLERVLGPIAMRQLSFTRPSSSSFRAVVETQSFDGALLSEYIAGAEVGRYNRIRDAVRREYSKNELTMTGAILAAVVGTSSARYADGIFGLGRRSIEQIIRTVQNGVVSAARDLLYRENDYMFSGVQWTAILDTRTSDICQHLDATIFPLDQGPRPPAHRNCRSTITPIVRSWEELRLQDLSAQAKAELNGQAPDRLTYAQWLRRQPAAIQDEVLGPTRGRMYRKGEVSFDRFVDKGGRRYTLDELRKREGIDV